MTKFYKMKILFVVAAFGMFAGKSLATEEDESQLIESQIKGSLVEAGIKNAQSNFDIMEKFITNKYKDTDEFAKPQLSLEMTTLKSNFNWTILEIMTKDRVAGLKFNLDNAIKKYFK